MHQKEEDSTQINWRRRGRIPQGCLGGPDPRTRVEDGVDQVRIWCEGEEGRRRGSPLFVRRQEEKRWVGGLGPWGLSTYQGQTPGSLASGPFATSAGQRAGGQCGPGARRQGPWRLLRNPDARDVGVTQKGQKRNFFLKRGQIEILLAL